MSDTLQSQEVIGKYIKENRERIGYKTAKEFSKVLNVSAATVSNWENGIKAPTYSNYVIMAGLFGITVDDLLAATNTNELFDNYDLSVYFNNESVFLSLDVEKRKEIVEEFIMKKRRLQECCKRMCRGNIGAIKLVKKLLEEMPCSNLFSYTFDDAEIFVIEKIDDDFDIENLEDGDTKDRIKKGHYVNGIHHHNIDNDDIKYNEGDDSFYVIDKNSKRAYVKTVDFRNYESPEDFTNKVFRFGYDTNIHYTLKLWDLININSDENDKEFLNPFSNAILFNEDFDDLRVKYIKQLSSLEKHLLLEEYLHQCKIRNINARTEVLYDFINNDAKFINDFKIYKIDYDYERTFKLTKKVMISLRENREFRY